MKKSMFSFINKEKLNAAEIEWLKKLQAVFNDCPSGRLLAFADGDSSITICDLSMEQEINEYAGRNGGDFRRAAEAYGAVFAQINTPFPIQLSCGETPIH